MSRIAYVIQTYELVEAVESLFMASRFLDEVPERVHSWKWVVIALHNAMQGFMVTALLEGNMRDNALERIGLIAKADKLKELRVAIESGEEWGVAYEKSSRCTPLLPIQVDTRPKSDE